jgi:hypothetical protein
MKKTLYFVALIMLFSCESYLDVPREALDITNQDVWGKYLNAKTFTTKLYPDMIAFSNQHAVGIGSGDFKRAGFPNISSNQLRIYSDIDWDRVNFDEPNFSSTFCNMGSAYISNRGNDFKSYWRVVWIPIRRANEILENVKYITDAPSQDAINQLRGQAFFARAYAYSYILDLWGGMPYITSVLNFESDMNLPRLSYHETVLRIANDCDSAASLLPASWKTVTSLDNIEVGRFTSVAAKALKARVLLYDASPLSNTTNDNARWEKAAEANWEALDFALKNGYSLLTFDKYPNLFHSDFDNTEFIYVQNELQKIGTTNERLSGQYFPPSVTNDLTGAGVYVTQNMVDCFEAVQKTGNNITKALPSDIASTEGFYNTQNPYINRDPRFYLDIIYHGKSTHPIINGGTLNPIKIDVTNRTFFDMTGPDIKQNFEAYTNQTCYYIGKFWDGASNWNKYNGDGYAKPCAIIRLAELYLNYAEAANEAYQGGSGKAIGATMTALEAVNAIRARAKMPAVDNRYTSDYTKLRERILNERAVELCFEANHPFVDGRRWKLIETEKYRNTYKMVITKETGVEYPTGYKFEVQFYEQRSFQPRYYFFPIPKYDVDKFSNFLQNPGY